MDSGGDAGRLQKAGVTASEEDGWPGRIASQIDSNIVRPFHITSCLISRMSNRSGRAGTGPFGFTRSRVSFLNLMPD